MKSRKERKAKRAERLKITETVFKQTTGMLRYSFKNIFLFEITYKLINLLLLRPLLSELIYLTLRLQGYSVATNVEIKNYLLGPGGIIMVILAIPIMLAAVFFEFSVLIVFLYYGYQKKRLRFLEGIKIGAHAMPALYHKSSFLFAIYELGIIPFLNIGISSSILPSIDIPNFISGEISKFTGVMSVIVNVSTVVASITLLIIFKQLFLTIPSMVLEHTNFYQASKRSIALQKGISTIIFRIFRNSAIMFGAIIIILEIIKEIGFITSSELISSCVVVCIAAVNVLIPPAYLSISLASFLHLSDYPDFGDITSESVRRFFGKSHSFFDKLKQFLKKFIKKINSFGLIVFIKKRVNESRNFSTFFALVIIIIISFTVAVVLTYNPFDSQQKLVFGHRGCIVGVENTIDAVLNAASQEADYAEIDILLSSDGVPMVIHDSNLKRLAGIDKAVYDLTAAELQDITLKQNEYTESIATLDELCKQSKGNIKLLIELKSHSHETANIVDEVIKVVEQNGLENEAIYHTSEYNLLEELKEKRPDFKAGYIVYGKLGGISSSFLRNLTADFFTFEESIVNGDLIRKCHWVGKPIYVWTVNDESQMSYFYGLSVDGIITDFPQKAKNEALNIKDKSNMGIKWGVDSNELESLITEE